MPKLTERAKNKRTTQRRYWLERRFKFGRGSMKEVSPSFINEAYLAVWKVIKEALK